MRHLSQLRQNRSHDSSRKAPVAAEACILAVMVLATGFLAACAPSPAAYGQEARTSGQATTATQQAHTLTYVAVGASDAFGVGTLDPDRQSWPSVLAGRLGAHVHLINLGIPGARLSDALQNELPIALDANPDIVTVWLAANDLADGVALDAYGRDLRTLLAALRAHTHATVVVGNLPDLTLLPIFAGRDPTALRSTVAAWNAVISADCTATGATLVDLYSGWKELADHPEYIASDGFHPSYIGAQRLADLFAAAIVRAQGSRTP